MTSARKGLVAWMVGLIAILALATLALGCRDARAAPKAPESLAVDSVAAPGDSLPYTLSAGASPGATSYRWTVTATKNVGPLPANQSTTGPAISFEVAKPGSATVVDSVTFTASVTACNSAGCSAARTASWKYVRRISPPPTPGPLVVDSSQVIGLIVAPWPDSLKVLDRTVRPRLVDRSGCHWTTTNTAFLGTAPFVTLTAGPGYPPSYVKVATGYQANGHPNAACTGEVPPVCVFAQLATGRIVHTTNTKAEPVCQKLSRDSFPALMDQTRLYTPFASQWIFETGQRLMHIHEPWGTLPNQRTLRFQGAGVQYASGPVVVPSNLGLLPDRWDGRCALPCLDRDTVHIESEHAVALRLLFHAPTGEAIRITWVDGSDPVYRAGAIPGPTELRLSMPWKGDSLHRVVPIHVWPRQRGRHVL